MRSKMVMRPWSPLTLEPAHFHAAQAPADKGKLPYTRRASPTHHCPVPLQSDRGQELLTHVVTASCP